MRKFFAIVSEKAVISKSVLRGDRLQARWRGHSAAAALAYLAVGTPRKVGASTVSFPATPAIDINAEPTLLIAIQAVQQR